MNNDDNLDLLDLDEGGSVDTLPDAAPFASPRAKKPWLLLGIGVLVIILATYIIVRTVASDSSSSIEVDLDAPVVTDVADVPGDTIMVPPMADDGAAPVAPVTGSVADTPDAPTPAPAPELKPVAKPATPAPVAQNNAGSPVRVIEDRKDVTFNPDAPAPAPKPAAKPAAKKPAAASKPAAKPAPKKQVAAANGSWYGQFGSYSTRSLAENAGKKLRNSHGSLFNGRQFVVLAAVMKDGSTVYRLRVPFATSGEANSFCRNAKSDGLDCYVAK